MVVELPTRRDARSPRGRSCRGDRGHPAVRAGDAVRAEGPRRAAGRRSRRPRRRGSRPPRWRWPSPRSCCRAIPPALGLALAGAGLCAVVAAAAPHRDALRDRLLARRGGARRGAGVPRRGLGRRAVAAGGARRSPRSPRPPGARGGSWAPALLAAAGRARPRRRSRCSPCSRAAPAGAAGAGSAPRRAARCSPGCCSPSSSRCSAPPTPRSPGCSTTRSSWGVEPDRPVARLAPACSRSRPAAASCWRRRRAASARRAPPRGGWGGPSGRSRSARSTSRSPRSSPCSSTTLFGGHDHVLRTAGLTYAEYARQRLLRAGGRRGAHAGGGRRRLALGAARHARRRPAGPRAPRRAVRA